MLPPTDLGVQENFIALELCGSLHLFCHTREGVSETVLIQTTKGVSETALA